MACTCSEIMLGMKRSGSFNLNPDCEDHGFKSEWFNSDEQVANRSAQSERARQLQEAARAARSSRPPTPIEGKDGNE